MEINQLYYVVTILISLLPVYLVLLFGPERSRSRLIFFVVGLATASIAGGILHLVSINERFFADPGSFGASIARVSLAAVVEELIRYPGILIAQYVAILYLRKYSKGDSDPDETITDEGFLESASNIIDPYGMGAYFGVGYGIGETLAFYVYPRLLLLYENFGQSVEFDLFLEIEDITFRITAVMAHTALTFLALGITKKLSFWRLTILSHLSVNVMNEIYEILTPNDLSAIVVVMFTRFSLVLIAYFFLRPKVRYLSPIMLIFLLVLLFLGVVLIATLLFLLTNLLLEFFMNFP